MTAKAANDMVCGLSLCVRLHVLRIDVRRIFDFRLDVIADGSTSALSGVLGDCCRTQCVHSSEP